MRFWTLLALVLGCSNRLDPIETGVIPNVETDADTDTDTDADTDTDTDVDTGPQLDCAAIYDTPVPGVLQPEDQCVTERLYCGDIRFGTTAGGSSIYEYDWWLSFGATGNMDRDDVDGTERIYVLENLPPGEFARINVQSCDPVRAFWYVSGDVVPFCETTPIQSPSEHFYEVVGRIEQEAEVQNLNGSGSLYGVQTIIDSPASSDINYMIQVECGTIGG